MGKRRVKQDKKLVGYFTRFIQIGVTVKSVVQGCHEETAEPLGACVCACCVCACANNSIEGRSTKSNSLQSKQSTMPKRAKTFFENVNQNKQS